MESSRGRSLATRGHSVIISPSIHIASNFRAMGFICLDVHVAALLNAEGLRVPCQRGSLSLRAWRHSQVTHALRDSDAGAGEVDLITASNFFLCSHLRDLPRQSTRYISCSVILRAQRYKYHA